MLKKLRRRYVAISMSIISIVLISFYLMTCLMFFMTLTYDVRTTLQKFSSSSVAPSFPQIGANQDDNSGFFLHSGSVCVVEVKEFGSISILDFSRANMDESILSEAVAYAMNTNADFGHIPKFNLFYDKTSIGFGARIAFADSTQYYSYMRTFAIDGAILICISSLFLWMIVRFLAKISLKPVEKAWAQQKNFIGDASHELKTPLTVILTNSGILRSHKSDTIENQMKWINSTYEEANYMKELVDKLLLLAKTDNMSQKNMFVNVNLSELAMRLTLQYEPLAYEKGIMLFSDIDKEIYIKGDSVALNQIIHILLDNAIKYSGENGEVSLSLKRRPGAIGKKYGYVYLSTRNTGKPIPAEDIPHLFERFYRSDKARTSGSGYGLGLSICKNLATLHNADISVSSDELKGTVFTVKFKYKFSDLKH